MCIFVSADDFSEPVKVCYTHCRDSSGNLKCEIAEHLVRCSHPSSLYEMNQSMYKTFWNLVILRNPCKLSEYQLLFLREGKGLSWDTAHQNRFE